MTTQTASSGTSQITTIVLGIAAALLVAAVLSGKPFPLISDHRVALIALMVLGMALCASGGIGPVAAEGRWLQVLPILAALIGALILIVAGAALLGIALPLIADTRQAFVAVAVLSAAKVAVTLLDRIV